VFGSSDYVVTCDADDSKDTQRIVAMKKNNSVSIPGDMSNWSREELAFLYHRFVLKVNFTHNVVQNVSACIASTLWLIKPNLVRNQSITVLIISPPFDPLYSLFDF